MNLTQKAVPLQCKTYIMDTSLEIIICMGSSCFSRGNKENYQRINQYLKLNNLESKVTFKGKHCMNKCEEGPLIIINGKEYSKVKPEDVPFLLSSYFDPK